MASWEWSAPDNRWTQVALLSLCLLHVQLTWAAPPTFDNQPYVATLYEKTAQTTTLMTLPCSDTDRDSVLVSLPSGGVSPSSPCGNCFTVLPCTTPPQTFCLVYYAGLGTLLQGVVPRYSITVHCTAGGQTVSAIANVILKRNSPPTFDPNQLVATKTVTNTKTKTAGQAIYDVNAVDVDNDNIVYTMTTSPVSDNFEIGAGNGVIRAKNSLKSECNNFITFFVTISDGINNPVGPLAVQTTLEGSNQRPDVTNIPTTPLQIPEDRGKVVIHSIAATDDESISKLTYTLTANPPANQNLFGISGKDIRITDVLDYETLSARRTELTIVASDGFCTSEPQKFVVEVTDVNEPPDIQPDNKAYSVYEGPDFGPPFTIPWQIVDEDLTDTHTYEIVGGNSGKEFSIDPNTGQLSINGDFDIDNPNNPTSRTLRIEVTDKGGLKDRTDVILNFKDRNDKYPKIKEGNFGYSVCEGKRVGSTLDTLTCTDDDLTSPNKDVYITGGGSGITVLSGGSIILNSPPPLGQTISTTAVCHDRGLYPGTLSSITPVPISVTTVECPTPTPNPNPNTTPTPAPSTAAATATTSAIPTSSVVTGSDLSWIEENLWWIILAALLATALLALLAYMLYIYCYPYCSRCRCSRPPRLCQKRPAKPRPQRYKPRAITPVETPRQPSPPPAILPDPYLHDFWKERYPDDDYGNQPDRTSRPRPVTPEIGNGSAPMATGNNPEKPGGLSVPIKKKSRFCNIL